MSASRPREVAAVAVAILLSCGLPRAVRAADASSPSASAPAPAASAPMPRTGLAPAATSPGGTQSLQEVEITGARQRLDAARNGLSPDTGSTIYRFDRQDIENLPLGESTPLNEVLLHAPGVAQDSFGQLHVRGDHANLQYRIDGIVIPEAITGFGQTLETRFAGSMSLLTGALPAQFGYRTAGVVDIRTPTNLPESGGRVALTVGTRGHLEPSIELEGERGAFSYVLTGTFLHNDIGIENPTPERNAIHDTTNQSKVFGSLGYVLGPQSRVSVLFGITNNRFEIPNVPGQTPSFMLDNSPPVDSASLDANQRERNRFGALSYQGKAGADVDYQVSVFTRTTDVHYQPDPVGDLVFNGVAADITRRNTASGLQGDLSWRLGNSHTLRTGVFAQHEHFTVDNTSQVFPADDDGNQTSGVPMTIVDNTSITGSLWGVYVQDEWKATQALTVNYGLRYDKVDTVVSESQWSPRIGLVYDWSSTLRLHAGYARYFTPPPTEKIDTTSVQKFLGTTNALPSDANTAVRSERSNYFDVGAAWQATPQLTLGADAYWRDVSHLQDEGQFGNALIFSAFNYEKGRIGGLELTATYREKAWSAYGNVAFSRAMGKTVETGQFNFDPDELAYIASNWVHLDHDQTVSASAGGSLKLGGGWAAFGDVLYGSGLRRGFANSDHLPSYTQVNASVEKKFDATSAFGAFDMRLAVVNLFDRVYQLRDGSGIGVGASQYGARRSLYLTLGKNF